MSKTIQSVCVYCGSADNLASNYLEAAHEMGEVLARAGKTIIYGAGKTGLMGALADGALSAGGKVIGVTPKNLNTPVLIHANLTRLEVTSTIHERKAKMTELADAFIAMPGGYGTFEELFETLTWIQIGIHSKPVGLLNVKNYFDPVLALAEHAAREGFIFPEHRHILTYANTPATLLEKLQSFTPPDNLSRWVNR